MLRALGVKLIFNSSVEKITLDEAGKVASVMAMIDGEETEIVSKRVIIASGGFSGNPEFLKKYCPEYYDEITVSGVPLTGDGITMAAAVGANLEGSATMIIEGPRFDPHSFPFMALERDPSTLWVNSQGKRFADETAGYHVFESVYAMLKQTDKVCYTLLDTSILQLLGTNRDYAQPTPINRRESGGKNEGFRNSPPNECRKRQSKNC